MPEAASIIGDEANGCAMAPLDTAVVAANNKHIKVLCELIIIVSPEFPQGSFPSRTDDHRRSLFLRLNTSA
jgi:hypothetical protein